MGLAGFFGWVLGELFLAGSWIMDKVFKQRSAHSDPNGSRGLG